MDTSTERWNLDFVVAKSLRYHAYRRSFWGTLDKWSKTITILSGTAVLVAVVGKSGLWSTLMAFVVAVASASDLVIGFSQKERDHDSLYRAFSRFAQDIAETENPSEQLRKL